jgi:lipase ATG15
LSWIEVEIDDPQLDLPILVLALRGTDPFRISDYVEDIRMWTEPVALSILSTVFPTVRAWPRKTVEMIILGIHDFLFSLGLPSDTWSYSELVECISRIPREQYSQVVLTGHSLGGGMATVVAALTHLPVVGITPPGVYWSLAKHQQRGSQAYSGGTEFGDDLSNWMHHQSLTLLVENDWVNGIFDDHGGLVQMMTCDRSQESLELACHMLEGTICHIFDRCGDPRRRFDSCAHEYVLKDTLQSKTFEVLREVMPSGIESVFTDVWEKFNQPSPVGSRMFGNTVALLLTFFVAMPVLGGFLDQGVFL